MARPLAAVVVGLLLAPTSGLEDTRLSQLWPTDGFHGDLTSVRAERNQLQAYFASLRAQRKEADAEAEKAEKKVDETGKTLKIDMGRSAEKRSKEKTSSKKKASKEKKAAEGEKAEGEKAEGEKAEGEHAGSLFAMSMMGTVVILMLFIGLSLSQDQAIRTYTITAADNVMAVFLAVLFFQAYDDLLDEMLPVKGHKVIAAWLHAIVVLVIVYAVSFKMRRKPCTLAIFCAAAAHYGSFASMHAATELLHHHFSYELTFVCVGLFVLVALIAVIFTAMEAFRKKLGDDDEWQDRIDDVANDFGAMAVAVCWSLVVRALIAGEYHHIKADEESEGEHSAKERMMMLGYGVALIPISAYVVHTLSQVKQRLGEEDYWKKRTIMFVISFFCMSIAWAFLLWGEWQFEAAAAEGGPEIFNKVAFAMAATFVTALGIVVLAKIRQSQGTNFKHVRRVALIAMSLVVGWSWEESFDAAIETIAADSKHAGREKMMIAVCMAVVMVPVYVKYLKPYAMECEEAQEKEDEEEPNKAAAA